MSYSRTPQLLIVLNEPSRMRTGNLSRPSSSLWSNRNCGQRNIVRLALNNFDRTKRVIRLIMIINHGSRVLTIDIYHYKLINSVNKTMQN